MDLPTAWLSQPALQAALLAAAGALAYWLKDVPGLLIGALPFGHLPAIFVPGGPMPSGLPNDEQARVRQEFAAGHVGRDAFLHPYDGMIPLSVAGYILGTVLLLVHLYALVKRQQVQAFLLASPRNHLLAQILLAGGLFWFFLLVAPEGLGVLSRFRVGLAEFEGIRWLLQLACPVFLVLMVTQVKNLLFPRALGIFGLMAAAPLLSAAFLQEPVTRLLIPIWCYIVIFLSILWIGKPYLYRDMVNKICSKPAWWTPLCLGGMAYGAAILLCAILWW